jgi:hypothetical protein
MLIVPIAGSEVEIFEDRVLSHTTTELPSRRAEDERRWKEGAVAVVEVCKVEATPRHTILQSSIAVEVGVHSRGLFPSEK